MTEEMCNRVKERNRRGKKEKRNRQTSQERNCENLKKKMYMKNKRQKNIDIEKMLEKKQTKERMRKLWVGKKSLKYEEGSKLKDKVEERTDDEEITEVKEGVEVEKSSDDDESSEVEKSKEDEEIDIVKSINQIQCFDKEINSSIINKNKRDEETAKNKEIETEKNTLINFVPKPVRELSLYEKIREEFISQRNKEWIIYEKEWEKNEMLKYQI